MKRILLLMMGFLLFFTTGCMLPEYVDAEFYGVAVNLPMDTTDDSETTFCLLLPDLGPVFIPKMDVQANLNGEVYRNYEIQTGDLVRVWFQKADDVQLAESYPAQFTKDPSSMTVYKQGLDLTWPKDGTWQLTLPIDSLVLTSGFNLEAINIGDTLYFWHHIINHDAPEVVATYHGLVLNVTDMLITFEISENDISSVLNIIAIDAMTLSDIDGQDQIITDSM